jgi:2-octaprenylphenol hydroxylase
MPKSFTPSAPIYTARPQQELTMSVASNNNSVDVVIAGAGVVGASVALGLAQLGCKGALLDGRANAPLWSATQYDLRVVALTYASQQWLTQLGVWDGVVQRRVSPYTHMSVWDGQGSGQVDFDCRDVAQNNLGHIVELSALEASINRAMASHKNIQLWRDCRAENFALQGNQIDVQLHAHRRLQAKLLIAADGAQSALREAAQIDVTEHDYQHHALVAQIHCEKPHQQTAYQRFTECGPLAFLPLCDPHHCSIVWSQSPTQTQALLALDDNAFARVLERAFESRLGGLKILSPRAAFPLKMRHAKRYSSERFLLLGDAAHTMHPLAGQGLNLSLADVAEFCSVVARAKSRGIDVGLAALLRRFERQRRGDNSVMLLTVGGLKTLFEQHHSLPVLVRNKALNWVNASARLRRFFTAQAMGLRKGSKP